MTVETNGRRITREDLQQAFDKFLGEGQETAKAVVPQTVVLGAAAAVAVIAVAFLAGRRRGRRRSAVVVVRRV